MLKIKNFGNDRAVDSVTELQDALRTDYKGMHVSIVYSAKPHGMSRVVLVTVNDAGVITHTNNGTGPVTFDELDELRL